MKNKKVIIYVFVTIAIAAVSSIMTYMIFSNKNNCKISGENVIFTDDQYDGLNEHEIANEKEYSGEIPTFSVAINSLKTEINGLSNQFLKDNNIPIYEFDAGVVFKMFLSTDKYVGVKLIDVLKALGINEYDTIEFIGDGFVSILYPKEEISDKMYLAFYVNGELINEKGINLLAVDQVYNFSVEALTQINIK